MNKNSLSSVANEMHDYPLLEWISRNKQIILYFIVALFAFAFLGYRYISSQTIGAESDFFQAQNEFNRFEENTLKANQEKSLEYLNRLNPILTQYPDLQAKYDGQIAQDLIILQDSEKSIPYTTRTFDRLKNEPVNFYESYAKTSLLISSGQYETAVQEAQSLKSQLDQAAPAEYGETLYVFNLIRLAFLYQQLNQPAQEKQAWNDVTNFKGSAESILAANQLFSDGHNSLNQYVEERKKVLN